MHIVDDKTHLNFTRALRRAYIGELFLRCFIFRFTELPLGRCQLLEGYEVLAKALLWLGDLLGIPVESLPKQLAIEHVRVLINRWILDLFKSIK